MPSLDILKKRTADIIDIGNEQKFSVLLPLVQFAGTKSVLFEIRSPQLNVQPGEICFPGGRIEPGDLNAEATAIRETCEELGLKKSDLKIAGPLDLLITPFQTMITPFAGQINDYRNIKPNPAEVASVFYVPLDFFLNTEPQTFQAKITINPPPDFPFHLLPNGKTYNWRTGKYPVHFYIYEDHVIWGITARILNNFIRLLKQLTK
ncbi:MAG: NUDIX hydrolase [Peptococcaceae bacterium]